MSSLRVSLLWCLMARAVTLYAPPTDRAARWYVFQRMLDWYSRDNLAHYMAQATCPFPRAHTSALYTEATCWSETWDRDVGPDSRAQLWYNHRYEYIDRRVLAAWDAKPHDNRGWRAWWDHMNSLKMHESPSCLSEAGYLDMLRIRWRAEHPTS